MVDFFVSYHQTDRAWAEWIAWQLEAAHYSVVLQAWDFRPGQNFVLKMQQAATEARRTIAVLSPAYLSARFTQPEWAAAFAQDPTGEKRILVPVRVQRCELEGLLPQIIYIDLVGRDENSARAELLRSILSGRAKPSTRPVFPGGSNRSTKRQPSFPGSAVTTDEADSGTISSSNTEREAFVFTNQPALNSPEECLIDFVIITALQEELQAILAKLPSYQQLPPTDEDVRVYYQADLSVTFADGAAGSYRLVLLSLLGMGRVQAANATNDAVRRWHPCYILLVGIAGGIAEAGVARGDVLIADQIVDYELQKLTTGGPQIRWEAHRASPRLLEAARHLPGEWRRLIKKKRPQPGTSQCRIGPVATGDKVIAVTELLDSYRSDWPKLIGVEMEAGGVASAAFQSAQQPGFLMVRGVSDLADEHKDDTWRQYACHAAAAFALALLQNGPTPLSKQKADGIRSGKTMATSQSGEGNFSRDIMRPKSDTSSPDQIDLKKNSISSYQRISLTTTERQQVANLLFACPIMARKESRDVVLQDLRPAIQGALMRDHQHSLVDLRLIVDTCLRYLGGLHELMDAIKIYEVDSIPMQQIESFMLDKPFDL